MSKIGSTRNRLHKAGILPLPTEHAEQRALMTWATLNAARYPALGLLFAIPNGGHRSVATAGRLKAEGVKSGVPDLCLPVARQGFHALYIEMKREKGGVLSEEQKLWKTALEAERNAWFLCAGADKAQEVLEWYLGIKTPR